MLPASRLIRQLVACQHLQQQLLSSSSIAASASTAVTTSGSGSNNTQWPSQHQAVAHSSTSAASSQDQQPANGYQHQQQQPLPERALPPSGSYGLKITIKAHDLIFVKLASSAIRDLVLVNIAPKSRDVLPEAWCSEDAGVPWVNLAMPVGDRAIPTRRTHYTVISGPHVHKTAREQFARTTHTRVIQVATNNLSELDWLLHSIKMYKFVGVELSMRITSSSYLLPTSTQQQDAAQQPLLAAHKQRFAHLFGAAAPTSEAAAGGIGTSSNISSSTTYAALQQSLQELRADLHSGLLQQRAQLSASLPYARWQDTDEGQRVAQKAATAAAAAGGVAASKLPGKQLQDAVAQQLQGSSMLAAADESSSGSTGAAGSSGREQALLHAVDKLIGGLNTDALDRHKYFPFLMAFYRPDKHQLSPAEWMQAVLACGKRRQQELQDAAGSAGQQLHQAAAVLKSYQQHAEVTRAMLLLLLQQWYQAANAESRRQLVLPAAVEQVESMKPSK